MNLNTTVVFLEHARHFVANKPHSLHHRFRHHAVEAIRNALETFSPENMMISGLDEVITTRVPELTWTNLPHLPQNCFSHRNSFSPVVAEQSDEFVRTWGRQVEYCRSVPPETMGEIVLMGWATMHVGKALARLASFMSSVGHRPVRILVVRANFTGHNHHWLDWSEVEKEAERWLPILRFDAIYNMNFRGLASKAMKHCITSCSGDSEKVAARLDKLAVGKFRPAFLAVLEMVGRADAVPIKASATLTRPGLMIWQRAVNGDRRWIRCAKIGLATNVKADFTEDATVQKTPRMVHWIGSGGLQPVIAEPFSTTPYPSEYLAAVTAYLLGFISVADGPPSLTKSGHMFLNMLPSKAKDIDAPIRWHDLRQEDEGRATEWLERHFRLIKRALNSRAPSQCS